MIRVTVWNEFIHERHNADVAAIYPDGIHNTIAGFLRPHPDLEVRTATLEEPEHGLTEAVCRDTDVLLWWGHAAHDRVDDAVVARVHRRVLEGMGLVALHSAHISKVFTRVLGASGVLIWREAGERERVWVTNPGHPIAAGLGDCIEIEHSEMYGEPFGIPPPEEQVFISWYEGGEVFRGGNCWRRGNGKIFYFSPGHETYPIYHHPQVQQVIANAVRWARPQGHWPNGFRNVLPEQAHEKIVATGPSVHGPDGTLAER